MEKEKKYEIILSYKDGRVEKLVGVGSPITNGKEILIKSPKGKEIVRFRENVIGFSVAEYKGD